ncbi:hypothetical protein [Rothia sp. P7208]|uniref:hypothetical protein n=1 Tax=Rothia sp. P7208 TaxID=3402660 RepID=UPI003ABEC67E
MTATLSNENTLIRCQSVFGRLVYRLSVPGAFLSALWVSFGRILFDAQGELTWIFAISITPSLLVILLCGCYWGYRDACRYSNGRSLPVFLAYMHCLTWFWAFTFGVLCPDRRDGKTISALSQIFGEHYVGLAAGFGNTAGILTFVSAFAVFFLALNYCRHSAKLSAGITEEDEERIARESSDYEFLES